MRYIFITVDYMLFGWEYNTINFILHNAFHTRCIWNALQSKTVQVQRFVITGEGKKTQILEFEKVTLEDIQKKLKYKKRYLEILKKNWARLTKQRLTHASILGAQQ